MEREVERLVKKNERAARGGGSTIWLDTDPANRILGAGERGNGMASKAKPR